MDRGPRTGDPRGNVWGFDKHNTRVCMRVLTGLFYALFIVLLFVAVGWLCVLEVGGAVEALARSKRSYTWYTTAPAVEEPHMCRTCGRSYNTSISKVVISPVLRGQCGESTPNTPRYSKRIPHKSQVVCPQIRVCISKWLKPDLHPSPQLF